jgi:hypothetical protein
MSSSYRVLKLQSGEEIIAKIKGKKGEKIILENPMVFTTQLRSTPFGQTQEITFLKDWLINIEKDTVKIPENFIVTWNSPSTDVAKLYDAERKNKSSRDYKKSSTNPNENNALNKILEDLKKLEDQIDETEKNVQPPFPTEPPFPLPPGQSKNSIFMSMMLPPDFIKNLIEEGYLDLDDLDDLDYPEDDIGDFYEEINDHKYTGEEKTDPDYGNRWTDWNPDPLSDEYGDESL